MNANPSKASDVDDSYSMKDQKAKDEPEAHKADMKFLSKILKSPSFWSAIIAASALILSQFPPIPTILKGKQLQSGISKSSVIGHHMGRINFVSSISLHNTGAKDLWVAEIDGVIFTPSNKIIPLNAENYVLPEVNPATGVFFDLPLGYIPLQPGEHWNKLIRLYEYTTEKTISHQHSIISQFQDDIGSKLRLMQMANQKMTIEVDSKLVEEAISFFKSQFKLEKGEHKLVIAFKSEDGSVLNKLGFRFILDGYHISILESHLANYRYGAGVSTDYIGNRSITAFLVSLSKKESEKLYEQMRTRIP